MAQFKSPPDTEAAGCGVCADPISLRNLQLPGETAVVQFSHIHNRAGSNGPARRIATLVACAVILLIQGLESCGTAPAINDALVFIGKRNPVAQCTKSCFPRQEHVQPLVLIRGTDVAR